MRYEAQRVLGGIALSYPPLPRVRVRAMGKLSAASVINNKRRGGGGGGWYESAIAPSFIGGQ